MDKNFTQQTITELSNNLLPLLGVVQTEKENCFSIYNPKDSTITAILNYSKSLSIRKSKHVGFIETILN